jgi:hypothetical protein
MHGMALRTNANVISPTAFQNRKAWFVTAAKDGTFLGDPENRGKPPANPMTDPAMMEGMMGMMKGNVAMMVPQTLIMGWINAFFSGFVISTLTPPSFENIQIGAVKVHRLSALGAVGLEVTFGPNLESLPCARACI